MILDFPLVLRSALLVLLLLLAWPVWRLAIFEARLILTRNRKFINALCSRALLRGRPGRLMLTSSAYYLCVILTFFILPNVFHFLAASILAIFLYFFFSVQLELGTGRQRLPGYVTLFPIKPVSDRLYYLNKKRQLGPMYKIGSPPDLVELSVRPMVCIVDLNLGKKLLIENDRCLKIVPESHFSRHFPSGIFRNMSNQDHDRYAKKYRLAYARVEGDFIDQILSSAVCEMIASMKEEIRSTGDRGIDPRPYAFEMMSIAMAKVIFGIDAGTPQFNELRRLNARLDLLHLNSWSRKKRLAVIINSYSDFLKSIANNRTQADRRSVFGNMAIHLPDFINDENILCNLMNDYFTGTIDTSGLLVWTFWRLATNNSWRDTGGESQCDYKQQVMAISKEVLRLSQSEYVLRRAKKDIIFNGFNIRKGWNIRICVREAHRDESHFECPHSFNPLRFLKGDVARNSYMPLGLYRHLCIGQRIIHAANGALISELYDEYDLSKSGSDEVEHYWGHWNPPSNFRIHMRVRD